MSTGTNLTSWVRSNKKPLIVSSAMMTLTVLAMILAGDAKASWDFVSPSKFTVNGPSNDNHPDFNHHGDGAPTGASLSPDSIHNAVPKYEPIGRRGNPESYTVGGITYYPMKSAQGFTEQGVASWYGKKFHGKETSSGEIYDMMAMTAAHKTLPLPSYVLVKNLDNGRQAIVRVTDRGPFLHNRVMDLSYAAAVKLGVTEKGTARVNLTAITLKAGESFNPNSIPGLNTPKRSVGTVSPDGYIYSYEAASNDPSFRPATGTGYTSHAAAERARYGHTGQGGATRPATHTASAPAAAPVPSGHRVNPDGTYSVYEPAPNAPDFRPAAGTGYTSHAAAERARYGSHGQTGHHTPAYHQPARQPAHQPTRQPARQYQPQHQAHTPVVTRRRPAAPAAPAVAPTTRPAAPVSNGRYIQIASYSKRHQAAALQRKLQGKQSHNVAVIPAKVKGRQMYRVQVGPIARSKTRGAIAKLKQLGHRSAYVAR